MHAHQPLRGGDVGVLFKHVLVPTVLEPYNFEYQDVDKWWIAPCATSYSAFPFSITKVSSYTIVKNVLREFVS